jgi:aryl sulfotransferase
VTYLVVARHPLDMAMSLYHHVGNIDRLRLRQLTGQHEPTVPPSPRPPLRDWLLGWIDDDADPRQHADSLSGVMWHLSDAWARRGQANVELVHYQDLSAGLGGEIRRLAGLLGFAVPGQAWPALVRAATFDHMQASAGRLAPDPAGIFKSPAAFFRRGTSGSGRELLTDDQLARYHARTAQLAPPALLTWLRH